jgi:nucleotide-binding universal stress UspA family protein
MEPPPPPPPQPSPPPQPQSQPQSQPQQPGHPAHPAPALYRRILLPTDGGEASQRAILAGVAFAREIRADVVGLVATPASRIPDAERHDAASHARGGRLLADVDAAARDAGVPCRLEQAVADHPWEAIVETAQRLGCDLIVMASHGRRGIKGLLLGSETQKVLVHSTIPVLVHR